MSLINHIPNAKKSIELLQKYATCGDIQPHEAYVMLKESGIEDVLKEVIDAVKSQAIESLTKNFIDPDKKSYKDGKYIYTVRSGATRYYFTEVEEFKKVSAELKKSEPYLKVKQVEQKYKTAFLLAQKNQSIVDEETGELVDPSKVNVVYTPDTLSIKPL